MSDGFVNLYNVLGVSVTASTSDIRSAYKHKALLSHPDKGGSSESFRLVVHAFETLSSSSLRSAHDVRLARGSNCKRRRTVVATAASSTEAQEKGVQSHSGLYAQSNEPAETSAHSSTTVPEQESSPAPAQEAHTCHRRRTRHHIFILRLNRLQKVLTQAPSDMRLKAIEGMSAILRRALVDHMEARKCGAQAPTYSQESHPVVAEFQKTFDFSLASPCGSGCASETDDSLNGMLALGDMSPSDSSSSEDQGDAGTEEDVAILTLEDAESVEDLDSESIAGVRKSGVEHGGDRGAMGRKRKCGGINEVRARDYVYYDARVCFRNVTLASSLTRKIEDAIHYHAILVGFKQRVQQLEEIAEHDLQFVTEDPGDSKVASALGSAARFEANFRRAASENEELEGVGLSFQVLIDARYWVGRMIASPRVATMDEMLQMWRRMEVARADGWTSLRELWLDWMQVVRRSCWCIRTRSAEEAEAVVVAAEKRYALNRDQRDALRAAREERHQARAYSRLQRSERRASRQMAARKELLESRLPRAVLRAESSAHAIAAAAARTSVGAARRAARTEENRLRSEALRQARERNRADQEVRRKRQRWLRRQDLTMDEILSGFPGPR